MTDPKRITLPGPGSQPANPAPEPPPADSIATAVLGSLQATPPAQPELLDATDEDAPGFNPFKFQRITVPPALRADIIRWSREGKKEPPPVDTLPPHQGAESDLDLATAEGDEIDDGDDPGSVMPVGGSRAPALPLRSLRNFAIAVGLVLLPLAVLGVASTMRRQANTSRNASATPPLEIATAPHDIATAATAARDVAPAPRELAPPAHEVATSPRVDAPAAPPIETAERARATALSGPTAPVPSVTISPPPQERPGASHAKRPTSTTAPPSRSAEPGAPAATGGNALDRPFSLPK